MEGRVLRMVGQGDRVGAVSDLIQPYDLFLIGKAIFNLGKAAIIATLASRKGAQEAGVYGVRGITATAADLVTDETAASMSPKQMFQYLVDVMKQRPELGRLYAATARGLRGEALKRETLDILSDWARGNNREVQFVEEGVAQNMPGSRAGNFLTLQGNRRSPKTPEPR